VIRILIYHSHQFLFYNIISAFCDWFHWIRRD